MMTRSEVVRETARRTNYTIAVCNEIIREMFDIIADELEGHGEVIVPNFGKFQCKRVGARTITLPSGERVQREEHLEPKFKASDSLRRRVRA